jgi:hypothetical protein
MITTQNHGTYWTATRQGIPTIVCHAPSEEEALERVEREVVRRNLIGRRITLHTPYQDHTEGVIIEQMGTMRFGVHLDGYAFRGKPITVDLHRAEFKLHRGKPRHADNEF